MWAPPAVLGFERYNARTRRRVLFGEGFGTQSRSFLDVLGRLAGRFGHTAAVLIVFGTGL